MPKNHLADEKSPYLRQHAGNPVDWYPWREEAFERAEAEDKPVFLSIGYSTCHWCHVMERESFEDEEVAALMNDAFISVKVDREERPDIDQVYMAVCQMTTGGGGWPLTVIMTPDKKPFFTATYIPKRARFGRAGLMELIPQIQDLWRNHRDEIGAAADRLTAALRQSAVQAAGEPVGEAILDGAYDQLASRYDEIHGGFGRAPKFPTPHHLLFLLRSWRRTGAPKALEMVETTLHRMRQGGIYDHIGFGFHRYSTDDRWFLPHFEKMLYDQALMAIAYTEAFQATGDQLFRNTAAEIFDYVRRVMTDPLGGFYSAEDAESEGEEGKFYLWTTAEVRNLLDEADAEWFIGRYGFEEEGNFLDEAAGAKTGRNIPYLAAPSSRTAAGPGIIDAEHRARLDRIRRRLFEAREKRVRPRRDDKILTDWNGLMIAALARAARVFGEPRYAERATAAAEFIMKQRAEDGRLVHRYRDGEAAVKANLDDYAFFIWGLIELYEATFEIRYLEFALELTRQQFDHFADVENGGFFFTPDDGEQLLIRNKEAYDAAMPSGNSAAMLNLIRLARLTARPELEDAATAVGRAFQRRISMAPLAHTFLLCAMAFTAGPPCEIVLVGEAEAVETRKILSVIYSGFLPNKVVLLRSDQSAAHDVSKIAAFTRPMTRLDRKATVYICKNYSCEMPTNDIGRIRQLLGLPAKSGRSDKT